MKSIVEFLQKNHEAPRSIQSILDEELAPYIKTNKRTLEQRLFGHDIYMHSLTGNSTKYVTWVSVYLFLLLNNGTTTKQNIYKFLLSDESNITDGNKKRCCKNQEAFNTYLFVLETTGFLTINGNNVTAVNPKKLYKTLK